MHHYTVHYDHITQLHCTFAKDSISFVSFLAATHIRAFCVCAECVDIAIVGHQGFTFINVYNNMIMPMWRYTVYKISWQKYGIDSPIRGDLLTPDPTCLFQLRDKTHSELTAFQSGVQVPAEGEILYLRIIKSAVSSSKLRNNVINDWKIGKQKSGTCQVKNI